MNVTDALNKLQISGSAPKTVENFAALIENNPTDFIITHFENNTIYIITQYGKIGNLYSVETEQIENGFIQSEPVFNIRNMLGGDNIEVDVGIRYISEQLNINKPLLISLTLKDYKLETLKRVVQVLKCYK